MPALTVTESSESIKSIKQYADGPDRKYNASWQAFEKLRDCAIYNLCRSIRAQLIGEFNTSTFHVILLKWSFINTFHRFCLFFLQREIKIV